MKKYIQDNFTNVAVGLVFALILTGAGLFLYNRQVMKKALELQNQSEFVLRQTKGIFENIQQMDISGRGYALIREPRFLFWTIETAQNQNFEVFSSLDSVFKVQGFHNPKNYKEVKAGLDYYVNDIYVNSIKLLKEDDMDAYKDILKKDFGANFYKIYFPFSVDVNNFENNLTQEAQLEYKRADQRNIWVQVMLLIIGLPTLLILRYTLKKEEKRRKDLLLNLRANNQEFLFNNGEERIREEKEILGYSIENLKKASDFVNHISEGNYAIKWDELNDKNAQLNKNNLVGRLILMRDEMKKVKEEDGKRLWTTEGLSDFSEIIRNNQHNLKELTDMSLRFLVKYMDAQQGHLFIYEENEEQEPYLSLAASYAFDKKKHLEKRINIGQGALGQAYLEGNTVIMTQLPEGYTEITSGLGDATPGCLVIVPMKYNEKVQAIVELASFEKFEPYKITFLEKAGEFIASAITTAQSNEKTGTLLEQLQDQTEQLKAQEEEMRQSMEELEATQEEMKRKEIALQQKTAPNAG